MPSLILVIMQREETSNDITTKNVKFGDRTFTIKKELQRLRIKKQKIKKKLISHSTGQIR